MNRLLSVVALALLAACSTAAPVLPASSPAVVRAVPPDAVVTARLTSDGRQPRLELRSVVDGQALSVVLDALPVDAGVARLSAGSLLLSTRDGCRTVLDRLDLASGARTRVRVLDRPALGVTPSPDGRSIAFLSYPSCSPPASSSSSPGTRPLPAAGPAAYLPNVLAVTPLDGGPVRATATETPGHPFSGIAWSPDGSTIASTYVGDARGQIMVLSAASPDFRSARRLPVAKGCRRTGGLWTQDGLFATESCGASLDPGAVGRLVRLTSGGRVAAAWSLTGCLSSLEIGARPDGPGLVLMEHVGYGHGPCGRRRHWADRLVTLDVSSPGAGEKVVQTLPLRFLSSQLFLVG